MIHAVEFHGLEEEPAVILVKELGHLLLPPAPPVILEHHSLEVVVDKRCESQVVPFP
jgi:hypothetical protein